VSLLTQWVRQGTESFFATQRILLDLVTRQNANTISAVRERLGNMRTAPVDALTEMAGEGMSNFIAAQRVLLQLAQRQNELVLTGFKDRTPDLPPVKAMADMVRRGVDTFIDMQQHFLTMAAKQADAWIDTAKTGQPPDAAHLAEVAREAMETFVRSQKKFLDVVAEETAHATGAKNGKEGHHHKAELATLAREGAEALIDAQKKLLDIAAQQVSVNLKATRKAVDVMNPFPPMTLADISRNTIGSFVSAQKALLEVLSKPARAVAAEVQAATAPTKPPSRKRPPRRTAAATA
jgi:hypothetical protein